MENISGNELGIGCKTAGGAGLLYIDVQGDLALQAALPWEGALENPSNSHRTVKAAGQRED